MDDWKRYLLLRVGAAPVELKPNESLVLGRSPETDLTIPSQRVSRRHSELFWRRSKPWIRDLGSQNGTLVNGVRITGDTELHDGDEVSVGPFLCTFRELEGGRGHTGRLLAGPDSNALTQPMVGDAMAGNLEQMNLFELLQTLEFNQKSGTLQIFGSDGDGTLVFQNGLPTYARSGRNVGPEAVFDMLAVKTGQFSFGPQPGEETPNMGGMSVTSILLEAGRRMDEQAG